jgi:hypothetical protein
VSNIYWTLFARALALDRMRCNPTAIGQEQRAQLSLKPPLSGHSSDLSGKRQVVTELRGPSVRKLQLPLDRLEARLLAQGIEVRFDF